MFALLVLALAFSSLASATTITTFTGTVLASDPTQLGRLSRNGVPQDWAGDEAYPGIINTGVTYHYRTYDIPWQMFAFDSGDLANYVQVTVDSLSANTYVSAYAGSYTPANWLGDPGTSGNYFGTDPLFFQVLLTPGQDLILVVNNTAANNVGTGDKLGITVEGFTDNMYTDPTGSPVPEPASMVLLGTGVVAPWLRKKLKKA
jgi:hypothetical protein